MNKRSIKLSFVRCGTFRCIISILFSIERRTEARSSFIRYSKLFNRIKILPIVGFHRAGIGFLVTGNKMDHELDIEIFVDARLKLVRNKKPPMGRAPRESREAKCNGASLSLLKASVQCFHFVANPRMKYILTFLDSRDAHRTIIRAKICTWCA